MSKAEKIRKLANAIREYRGQNDRGRWIQSPRPHKARSVVKWLAALGHRPELIQAEMELIITFKTLEEFDAWIRELGKPEPLSTEAVMGGAA